MPPKILTTEINMISTERLELRRMQLSDAAVITKLANNHAISSTTMRMPYPCTIDYIENWIKNDTRVGGQDSGYFVICLKETHTIIGVIGLEVEWENDRAELGYWLGMDYWNNGYCTEAAKAMLEYGFNTLDLNRIWTFYIEGNSASGRILEKIGMEHEGTLKKHIKKNGAYKDLKYYGKLREKHVINLAESS